MVSQQERTRLMEAYKYEPTAGAEVMLRYATGLLFVVGLAVIVQVEKSQPVEIGVSSAHAGQYRMEPQGVQYFPDGYVNQAQDRYEHIQAF